MLRLFLAVWLAITPAFAWAGSMSLLGAGKASTGAASYSGPGDLVASATAWWGLRAYSLAKAGTTAANICNASDANCANVSTLANGSFDVATAQGSPLNCGGVGGTCTVKTLTDQTGNGNDVTQTTIASRPVLTFSCIGSLPCMTFAGSQNLPAASFNGAVDVPQGFSLSAAYDDTGTSTGTGGAVISSTTGSADSGMFSNDGVANTIECFSGSSLQVTGVANNSWHGVQTVHNGASSNVNVDTVDHTGNCGTRVFAHFNVGIGNTIGVPSIGNIGEAGVWPVAFSSGIASSIGSNQKAYWGF